MIWILRTGWSGKSGFIGQTGRGGRDYGLHLSDPRAGVHDFRELAAWQRAYELQLLCEELIQRPRVKRDIRYVGQWSDASSSALRNIAEGFGRFRPEGNAQYVRVAKGRRTMEP